MQNRIELGKEEFLGEHLSKFCLEMLVNIYFISFSFFFFAPFAHLKK